MQKIIHLWRSTNSPTKTEKLCGGLFGIMIILPLILPCIFQKFSEQLLHLPPLFTVVHAIIYGLVFISITVNFPLLVLLSLFGQIAIIVVIFLWSFLFKFWIVLLKSTDWEIGIWVGLYVVVGLVVSYLFTPLAFLECF